MRLALRLRHRLKLVPRMELGLKQMHESRADG